MHRNEDLTIKVETNNVLGKALKRVTGDRITTVSGVVILIQTVMEIVLEGGYSLPTVGIVIALLAGLVLLLARD